MAAPFFDPTQWLRTPSPVSTPAFNPQSDILDQLRQQQEEEEEKRLNAEKMLADLIERSRNKKEEERIERLRSEMPQDIYERLHKGYYGDPQSKAGKVGSAILQIGSGMFGTTPDINKASMEQWKAQQTAANAADTIQQREQAAAASAISRMQQSQSRMAETESKNKTTMAVKLIDAAVREHKNDIDRIKALAAKTGIDARALLDESKAKLNDKLGLIDMIGGFKDPGMRLVEYERLRGKEAADEVVKYNTGDILLKNYRHATPGTTSQGSPVPVVNGQTGEFIGFKPGTSRTTSGKPQIGDPNVLLRMRGLTTNDAVNPQAPQMPPMPQPAAGQPAPVPQPQAMAAAPAQSPRPTQRVTTPPVESADWAKAIGGYRLDSFIPSRGGSEPIKAAAVPRGTFIGGVKPIPLTGPEKAAQEATNSFISNT
ncbi:MAG: hypothetical protein E6Q97_03720, partial [Desulfurellales bacterium]